MASSTPGVPVRGDDVRGAVSLPDARLHAFLHRHLGHQYPRCPCLGHRTHHGLQVSGLLAGHGISKRERERETLGKAQLINLTDPNCQILLFHSPLCFLYREWSIAVKKILLSKETHMRACVQIPHDPSHPLPLQLRTVLRVL